MLLTDRIPIGQLPNLSVSLVLDLFRHVFLAIQKVDSVLGPIAVAPKEAATEVLGDEEVVVVGEVQKVLLLDGVGGHGVFADAGDGSVGSCGACYEYEVSNDGDEEGDDGDDGDDELGEGCNWLGCRFSV